MVAGREKKVSIRDIWKVEGTEFGSKLGVAILEERRVIGHGVQTLLSSKAKDSVKLRIACKGSVKA